MPAAFLPCLGGGAVRWELLLAGCVLDGSGTGLGSLSGGVAALGHTGSGLGGAATTGGCGLGGATFSARGYFSWLI